ALLMPVGDRRRARGAASAALHLGKRGTFTGGLLCAGGEPRAVAWSVQPVSVASKRGALALGHDITDLKAAQRKALDAERLATLGQVAATLAHESRNLLQSMSACLERLSWRVQGDESAAGLLARAEAARDKLARLFDDVQRHAAPLRLDLGECDLAALWRETWAEVLAASPGREATLEEEGAGTVVRADRFRLGQVFRNILENALAAASDPVRVRVMCHDEGALVRLSFRDNGPGLDAEQRRHIFESFFTTKARGTGLGLAICKRIVETHGGRIEAGENGPGAEIVVRLPKGT
ncbi:MAG: HAMP domain-containing histidine kinase, partial [Gemmataceae bacterium]|nr:HAMP domain-containing histidine kinase [Gemmataceae bacterium]